MPSERISQEEFERILDGICAKLTEESNAATFKTASQFENRVRELLQESLPDNSPIAIDFDPHPQAFPEIGRAHV